MRSSARAASSARPSTPSSHKADVKQRVSDNPVPLVAVAGGVVALWLLLRLVRRR